MLLCLANSPEPLWEAESTSASSTFVIITRCLLLKQMSNLFQLVQPFKNERSLNARRALTAITPQ